MTKSETSKQPDPLMEHKSFEIKLDASAKDGEISGFGAVYGNTDQGGDIMLPGSAAKSLASGRKIKMLWQHNPSEPIGVWDEIKEEESGIRVRGRVLESLSKGREVLTMLREGIVDGLSIGYRTIEATRENGLRQLKEIDLWEISVVTFPMNALATVTDVKQLGGPGDVERILRDAGVPNNFAKLVASHGFEEAKARIESNRREGGAGGKLSAWAELNQSLKDLKEAINA